MNYPQVEQLETRDGEVRADLRLLREQRAAGGQAAATSSRSNRLQRLVALTLARVGGR